MDNVFGIKFQEVADPNVKVWIDDTIKEENKNKKFKKTVGQRRAEHEDTQDLRLGKASKGTKGQLQATARDERVYKLRLALKSKEVKTLQQAIDYLEVAESTLISYLKEIGEKLYDTNRKKDVGALDGIAKGRPKVSGIVENNGQVAKVEYYDCDPKNGGKKITKKEHTKKKGSKK